MIAYELKQGQTAQPLLFLLVLSSDHLSPATGKTPTVTISKNGAAFASPAGAVTEVGNGVYKVAGNATDSNTLGPLWLHATEASSDPTDTIFPVVAYDPQDAVRLGLSALPNAAAAAAGGLPTVGTGTGQLALAGGGVTLADGVAHGGVPGSSTATLAFSQMVGQAQTVNASAVAFTGNGSGSGLLITGGATGTGLFVTGGATSGVGLRVVATAGDAMRIVAGSNAGAGMRITGGAASAGNTGGPGIIINGGAASTGAGNTAGIGLQVVGGPGAASVNGAASGVSFSGGGTNTIPTAAYGLVASGTSNGDGFTTIGAGTGVGARSAPTAVGFGSSQAFPANFAALAITAAGGVTLADGVAHGGPPGSSTATLALSQLNISSTDVAVLLHSSGGTRTVQIVNTSYGIGVDIETSGGSAIQLYSSSANATLSMVNDNGGTGLAVASYGSSNAIGVDISGLAHDVFLSGNGDLGGDLAGRVLGATATPLVGVGVRAEGGAAVTVGGYAAGQDPATLVLDVPALDHNTADTIGAAINTGGAGGGGGGGSGSDPLANLVPGHYASGTAGAALGRIAGALINVTSPISSSGDVRLVRGDAYLASDGRGLVYTDASDVWPDHATAVWNLYATSAGGDLVLSRAAPVAPAVGPGKAAIVSLSAADTASLANSSYHLALILTRPDATPMTVARGTCYVSDP